MPKLSHLFETRLQELLSSSPKRLEDYSNPSLPGEIEGWLISGRTCFMLSSPTNQAIPITG